MLQAIDDLNRAIEVTEEALANILPDHHNRAEWLGNLAIRLGNRFKVQGIIADLNRAVQVASMVVDVISQDHPGQSSLLSNVRNWLGRRVERTGSLHELDRAIEAARTVLDIKPRDDSNRAHWLNSLGSWLGIRFAQTDSVDDLNYGIQVLDIAINTTPQDRPDQATCLRNLENLLGERYKLTSAVEDLNRAAEVARMAQAAGAADLDKTATTTSEKLIPNPDKMKRVLIWVDEQLQRRVKLLVRRITKQSSPNEKEDVNKPLALLTYLPLAITQACAFINKTGITVAEYISLLQQSDTGAEVFCDHFEDPTRDRELDSTIAKTWHISFDHIQSQDPLAAEYLSFMACINNIKIPRSLLPPSSSLIQTIKAIGTLKG
ncbi:Tetratricopeptide-like helical protein [Rutstroemia sp. NJR-2017a BVV2]|nr:Tetratricopeptide-like helical protein [Rutstroemia sp. NJR-2017a BVV2]